MGVYRGSVNARAGVNTANTPYFQLKTAAGERAMIKEFGITVSVAPSTAPQFALARSTATGTSSTTVLGTAADPAEPAALTTLDSAWSVAPTFNTAGPFLWAATMPVTAGAGYVWVAPDDRSRIVVPVSSGLILANIAAAGATLGSFSFYVVWDE